MCEAIGDLQLAVNVWLLKEILEKKILKISDTIIQLLFHTVEM